MLSQEFIKDNLLEQRENGDIIMKDMYSVSPYFLEFIHSKGYVVSEIQLQDLWGNSRSPIKITFKLNINPKE